MNFNSESTYICSIDNAELIDIYSPDYDDDDYLKLPENFENLPLDMKETLKSRHQTLVETLEMVNRDKREKLISLVSNREAIILVCPSCKKVYDSKTMMENQDLYHSSSNMLPVRKPKKHGVVSDDRESVENARNTMWDLKYGGKQIFFPNNKNVEETIDRYGNPIPEKDNRTVYKATKGDMQTPDKIKHASQHLKNLADKYGTEQIDINIQIPE